MCYMKLNGIIAPTYCQDQDNVHQNCIWKIFPNAVLICATAIFRGHIYKKTIMLTHIQQAVRSLQCSNNAHNQLHSQSNT